jgi:hypothetical protein
MILAPYEFENANGTGEDDVPFSCAVYVVTGDYAAPTP